MHHEEAIKGAAYELDGTGLLKYKVVFVWEPITKQHAQFAPFKMGGRAPHPSYLVTDEDVSLPEYFLAFKDFTFVKRVPLKR
jgi:hypothetical protein